MTGITPYRTLHFISRALPTLTTRDEIEAALNEIEYLLADTASDGQARSR